MNKEIKKILDKLGFTNEDMMWCDEITLNTKQSHLLLDYITNLQKTNKNHSKKLIELGNKITNLQQEINKLTAESTEWESKYYEMQDNFHNANEEIERLKENNQNMQEEMARTWQKYDELQQENEYLKLSNPEMNIEHFRIINENKRKIDNLRKRNKELQQETERQSKAQVILDNMLADYKQENERLKEANKILEENWKHYMMICGKAIEDIKFCLHSIKQEYEMSTDERTRNEMESCVQIFNKTLNILQNGSDSNE